MVSSVGQQSGFVTKLQLNDISLTETAQAKLDKQTDAASSLSQLISAALKQARIGGDGSITKDTRIPLDALPAALQDRLMLPVAAGNRPPASAGVTFTADSSGAYTLGALIQAIGVACGGSTCSLLENKLDSSTPPVKVLGDAFPEFTDFLNGTSSSAAAAFSSKLDVWAAKERSRLSTSHDGGVQVANGKIFVGGKEVSLQDLFYAARMNQLGEVDRGLQGYFNEIAENNIKAKEGDYFVSLLRREGLNPGETIGYSQVAAIVNKFSSSYGYDPLKRFLAGVTLPTDASVRATQKYDATTVGGWIETAKGWVVDRGADNQIAQLKLEKLNNKRNEILEGVTTFTKSQTQIGQSVARNM